MLMNDYVFSNQTNKKLSCVSKLSNIRAYFYGVHIDNEPLEKEQKPLVYLFSSLVLKDI